ncbi:MAG TPA: FAD-dependent oxidoreductase [Dehalococcoidia bacterium]|nr:FAD-dependent oxidoreductase [Dehalococcoidia bacterium]
MYDLMVIGGGPAGLAATVYAARKQLNAVLISQDIGGQMNWTLGIENYLGYQFIEAPELISKFQSQVDQFPIDQKIGDRISQIVKANGGYEAVLENGDRHQSKAVIMATGKKPRMLNVPGEKELGGRGVTYCAICDGPIFTGQRVAVVGGGNSAVEAVLDMEKIAEHVDLVSLTPLTADPVLTNQLTEGEKLNVYTEYETVRIEGDPLVDGIVIKDSKSGEEKRLDVTGVFIEIGLIPNSESVKDILELNKAGEISINRSCETALPGLFAAGDVTDVPEKQIVIAAGEGAKAALGAHRYLQRLS